MKYIIAFLLTFFTIKLSAQFFEGYATSNYAGINAVHYNPASIVDSRVKLDINFFSFSGTGINNYLGFDARFWNLQDTTLFEKADYANDGGLKNGILTANLMGPSFLYTLNEKNSFGFSTSFKTLYNHNNISNNFLNYYFDQNNASTTGIEKDLAINQASWVEYGVFYGREIYSKGDHWISGGLRLKLLQGIYFNRITTMGANWNDSPDSLSVSFNDLSYRLSNSNNKKNREALGSFENWGLGFDIGFNYEYRPDMENKTKEINGKVVGIKSMSKHKIRVGWTVNDVGFIQYKIGAYGDLSSYSTSVSKTDVDFENWVGLINIFNNNFTQELTNLKHTFYLPATTSFQFDYHIYRGFYANIHTLNSLVRDKELRYINRVTFVPRWDWKWLGVYLPQTLDETGVIRNGVNIMFGPFILGTNDLSTFVTDGSKRYLNVNAGVKVTSHHYRVLDRDEDGVTDDLDECPDVKGLWVFKGCPDLDGDSVPDKDDECPTDFGLVKYNGCPDRDEDGLIDKLDSCPDDFGVIELNGCPDFDLDGIMDQLDSCPFTMGLAEFHGCPDFDDDGIPDRFDACPLVAGDVAHRGCPDTDADGLYDNEDECVYVYGPKKNKGCPYGDIDADGVLDPDDSCPDVFGVKKNNGCPDDDFDNDSIVNVVDSCPNTFGLASNNGCPIIEKEAEEIINLAFKNLQFETNKWEILPESFESLNKLVELLKTKKDWNVELSGYTDDVGAAQANLILSKNRSFSVKTYLVKNGIDANRISVTYFGESNPVASNKTKEGREQNRRVEMKIIFK